MPRYRDNETDEIVSDARGLLLGAATEEFAGEGYNGSNVNRIARQAGFAKGTIYNYFPSKRALMLALIDAIAASHVDFAAARVREEEDPVRCLERFFEAGAEWMERNLSQGRVMLGVLNGPHPEFRERMPRASCSRHLDARRGARSL